jgi:thiamine pyrophosphate-dependent acetolactate synthase large subunit-like protein
MSASEHVERVSLPEAVADLCQARTDEVVITTMGSSREWMKLPAHLLDFHFVPSSMGQATSLGLGIALARPDRRVVVCNGDGSLLMNLGTLVTIATASPANLTMVLFDNEVYEVTGAQPTPGSVALTGPTGAVDFPKMARAAGWRSVFEFATREAWREGMGEALASSGPTFVLVKVPPVPGARGPKSPGPGKQRAEAFRQALAGE